MHIQDQSFFSKIVQDSNRKMNNSRVVKRKVNASVAKIDPPKKVLNHLNGYVSDSQLNAGGDQNDHTWKYI